MVDFFDEVSGHELCKLILDGLFSVLRKSVKPFLDWFCSFFYVDGVLDHLPGDTRHVRWLPSEYVLEGDEHAFLFSIELCPNQGRFGRVRQVEHNLLELL